MNFTEDQLAEMVEQEHQKSHHIWQIQLAVKTNNLFSHYHPSNIRRRIREEAQLLRAALSKHTAKEGV